ncbi:MAG TPA: hypothetical protein VEK07_23500 [Polyangiaceae bacterium]|nr:hypothetical protein [Polyangiaceae bacterium]
MSYEEIGAGRQPSDIVVLRGEVTGDDEDVAGVLDAKRQGRGAVVVDRDGSHPHVSLPKNLVDRHIRGRGQIRYRKSQIVAERPQVPEGAKRAEEEIHERGRAREIAPTGWSEDAEGHRLIDVDPQIAR